jgi:predicted acylesterase/phospholipase RssA
LPEQISEEPSAPYFSEHDASVTTLDVPPAGRVIVVLGLPSRRAAELVEHVSKGGAAADMLVVREGDLPPELSRESTERRQRISRWLSQTRRRSRCVVVLLDADASALSDWTAAADTALLVCEAATQPPPSALQLVSSGVLSRVRLELALIYPSRAVLPTHTARWIDALRPAAHHHLREGNATDHARLARFLCGDAVALVLSSGAARGFAHLGVWKALQDAGHPIDLVGGTSMGSVIAAEIALGWDPREATRRTRDVFLSKGGIFDWRLPAVSLLHGERLTSRLRQAFGEHTGAEDLWVPWFCVTSNLTRAAPVTHTRGPLWKLVRASGSVPGMAPPVEIDGELHVDGGMTALVPVEQERALGARTVVAVNVMPHNRARAPSRLPPREHAAKTLWRRHGPKRDRTMPSIFDVVKRSLLVSLTHRGQVSADDADLCIEPEVDEFRYLDPRPIDRIVEAGRAAAVEALREWRITPATAVVARNGTSG